VELLLLEPGYFVIERGTLGGLRKRCEAAASTGFYGIGGGISASHSSSRR
jgi:hypothetical protein